MQRHLLSILLLAAAFPMEAAAAAPTPLIKAPQIDKPTRVLFVGNSYLYYGDSLHSHVSRMAIGAHPEIEKEMTPMGLIRT